MNKKTFIILTAVLAVLIAGVIGVVLFGFFGEKKDKVDWDDAEWVFDIDIPEDFNEYEIERAEEKIKQTRELYDTDKEDNWTWISLGNLYEFVGDYEKAILVYHKAIEVYPVDIVAHLNLATIYENYLVDYPKAEEYYKKVLEINSYAPDFYNNLARLYLYKMDRPEDAEAILLKGVETTGNNPDLLLSLINFYEKQGKEEERINYIKKLLELYPDDELYQQKYGGLVE